MTMSKEKATYEEGYKKGYEKALFDVINAIINIAEEDNGEKDNN